MTDEIRTALRARREQLLAERDTKDETDPMWMYLHMQARGLFDALTIISDLELARARSQ